MLSRAFAVVCDAGYYPGLIALLNSIWAYHQRTVPVLLYHRGLSRSQICALQLHKCDLRLYEVTELGYPSPGMWEAKQQILAHRIGRIRCVYLLDADLVLVSNVDDIFELAEAGKIVSSADGPGVVYDAAYAIYSPRLPGLRQAYVNTGALCLEVTRHWDLAGLWAFASSYGAYSPGAGGPLGLPGHGDQGVFNAIATLLGKGSDIHVLPEGVWCDSSRGCTLRIRHALADGRIEVWNLTDDAPQRLVHSSGPKWWTAEGVAHLSQFGDKYRCFQHFSNFSARSTTSKIVVGICSSGKTARRRAAIRETWMTQMPPCMRAVFFVGRGSGNGEADVVERSQAGESYAVVVTGKLPVNQFSATGAGAPGIGSITQSATGGSLPANVTLRVAICAIDSSGLPSAPSNIAIVGTSTSGTDTFTLEGITWPAVAGLVSYVLFVATQDDLICAQATGTLTAGANNTYTPGSITFAGPLVRSTWALPSPYVSKIRVKRLSQPPLHAAGDQEEIGPIRQAGTGPDPRPDQALNRS